MSTVDTSCDLYGSLVDTSYSYTFYGSLVDSVLIPVGINCGQLTFFADEL